MKMQLFIFLNFVLIIQIGAVTFEDIEAEGRMSIEVTSFGVCEQLTHNDINGKLSKNDLEICMVSRKMRSESLENCYKLYKYYIGFM